MPRVYIASFGVHNHELDAFGELRASTYARLLQQTATDASADAGYPQIWYADAGTFWLVRRTTIEYLQPVRASDTLRIRTWVADFRRVRSQREYEVYSESTQTPVARAHTDWVYVERSSGRPRRIPQEMIESFMPVGVPPPLPRNPLVNGTAPPGAFCAARRVEFRDLDALAHVNNASYLDYIEQAAMDAAAAVGWPLERAVQLGFYWRPQLHDIEYLAEAFYGNELRCITWVTVREGPWVERQSEIRRAADDLLLARARSRWVWVRLSTREPADTPDELGTALASDFPG
jgi:acyl-CoA thioester hydrolase